MKNNKKGKGFTLTELVIVIVVIALLAAVLIPTYSGLVNKAKDSNDTSLVKMLNDAMMDSEFHEEYKHDTYQDVIDTLYEYGFVADNLQAKSSKNVLVWNQVTNRFYILSNEDYSIDTRDSNPDPSTVYYPENQTEKTLIDATNKYTFWVIYNSNNTVVSISEANNTKTISSNYSVYLAKDIEGAIVTTKGIDVGKNTNITSITYNNNETNVTSQDVIIRSNSAYTNIRLDAYVNASDNTKGDHVDLYGKYGDITGTTKDSDGNFLGFKVAFNSLGVKGTPCGGITCESGHLDFDDAVPFINSDGTIEEIHVHATSDNVIVSNGNNYEIHAHADSEGQATTLNSKAESTNVAWDYNNNTDQEGTAFLDDIWHHVGESASDPKSTACNYSFNTDANETLFEAKAEETSKSEESKALYGFMNINKGKGYGFGEEEFDTAIHDASTGDTIMVLNDFEVSGKIQFQGTYRYNIKSLTINLNGNTITDDVENDFCFKVQDFNLTVNGNGGSIQVNNPLSYGIFELSSGYSNNTLDVKNIELKGDTNNGTIIQYADGSYSTTSFIKLENITGETNNYFVSPMLVNGNNYFSGTADINVSDSYIKTGLRGFISNEEYHRNKVTFSNVTAVSDQGPVIEVDGGTASFTDCNFTISNLEYPKVWHSVCIGVSYEAVVDIYSGTYTSKKHDAVEIYTYGGTINIYGGTFNGAEKSILTYATSNHRNIVNIYGGTFVGELELPNTAEGINSKYTITGGNFDNDPSNYVRLGYAAVENEAGWTVQPTSNVNEQGFIISGTYSKNPTEYVADGYVAEADNYDNPTSWMVGKVAYKVVYSTTDYDIFSGHISDITDENIDQFYINSRIEWGDDYATSPEWLCLKDTTHTIRMFGKTPAAAWSVGWITDDIISDGAIAKLITANGTEYFVTEAAAKAFATDHGTTYSLVE